MDSKTIPILFVVDLSAERMGFDYYRMFLTCFSGLLQTCSSPLDVAIVEIGWKPRQKELVRALANSSRTGATVRFFGKGDRTFDRVSEIVSRYRGKSKTQFGLYVWYKISPNSFFNSDRPVIVCDTDVAFMDDVTPVYEYALGELERGAGIVAMPELVQSYNVPFREGKYFNSGFFVADFSKFGSIDKLIDRANEYNNNITGEFKDPRTEFKYDYGAYPEQDFLYRYCVDEGIFISAFLPDDVGCPYNLANNRYPEFGLSVDKPLEERLMTMRVCHLLGDNKSQFYDTSTPIGLRMKKAVYVADSLLSIPDNIPYPLYSGQYFRNTDVTRVDTPSGCSALYQPRYRTVVVSNVGSGRRDEFLLPSVMSLLVCTTCPLRIVMLYSDDSLDDMFFRDRVGRMIEFSGRDVVVEYRRCTFDLGVFSSNRYGGANMFKLFSSRLFPDADGYYLYMDSDVLVIQDISPLFTFCCLQPTADKIIGCQSHFVVSTNSYSTPAQFMGGFFFMHPLGFPSRAALGRLFAEEWHDNDEYVIAQCIRASDLVSIGNAVVEPLLESSVVGVKRRSAMKGVGSTGGTTYAVHFSSSARLDRFNKPSMPSFGKYVDLWAMMKRLVAML